jgi:hypothetical protein
MAIIKKGVIGEISGKIGDKIYRVRDGKNIVCKRPASQKISQTTNSVKNRSKFAFRIQLAKLIYSTPELSACWKSAKIKGRNGFQRIIVHNAKQISDTGLTLQTIITPPGFATYDNFIKLDKSHIIIQSKPVKEIFDCTFKLIAVLCLYNEKGSELLLFQSDDVIFNEGSVLKGIISLDPDEMRKITLCNKALLLSSFLTFSPELLWSSTIPFEIVMRD